MLDKSENMHEGDGFLLAGNTCVVDQIYHQEGRTLIVFSFLGNPDDCGSFVCGSDTVFRIIPDCRSTTI